MHQTGTGGGITLKNSVVRRGDNRLYFARQASSAQGLFMRQASTDEVHHQLSYFIIFFFSSGD